MPRDDRLLALTCYQAPMIPGHPVGQLPYNGYVEKAPPSPKEVGEIFQEQDALGFLSPDSWIALRRLALSLEGEPAKYGSLICRPDDHQFQPDLISDNLTDARWDELSERDAPPTTNELELWRQRYMECARGGGPGLYTVMGWEVRDDREATRMLVTLHLDHATLERVAGLYATATAASADLETYGAFEWIW